jgi:hypothetical protein
MIHGMPRRIWAEIRRLPPGERFQHLYASYVEHDSAWLRGSLLYAALACFTLGCAFMIASGPAYFFWFLAGALVATQSGAVARQFDSIELGLRNVGRRFHRQRFPRPRTIRPLITAPPRDSVR